ncbi:hypothetical protein TrVE_jg8881 [Triparma verrucosa]|uniref:Uncharacterized protein n=1 Tax=Triparma verrucosa TaxID=1606542 RepID=A0A9W7F1P9_9STRA|nr:hypothetical protein TrVE_jg8881 [Triparma verrucosa]
MSSPPTSLDSRYKLGRTKISTSDITSIEKGIEILGTLLRASIDKNGERSVETAVLAYEYGRGLLRAVTVRRETPQSEESEKVEKFEKEEDEEDKAETKRSDEEDLGIAMENVELAWEVFQRNAEYEVKDADNKGEESEPPAKKMKEKEFVPQYSSYCLSNLARVMIGHGDLCTAMSDYQKSYKSYLSGMTLLEADVERLQSVEKVVRYRRIVDCLVCVCESLLGIEGDVEDADGEVIIEEKEKMETILGYYTAGRESLQKCVYAFGEGIGEGRREELEEEKGMVCQISVLLMAVEGRIREREAELKEAKETKKVKKGEVKGEDGKK